MEQEAPVVHAFDGKPAPTVSRGKGNESIMNKNTIIIFVGVVLLAILSGFLISNFTKPKVVAITSTTNIADIPKGTAFGSDAKNFKDSAQGVLKKGGIEGEGAYHLERSGGPSQNVYLTSSVLDLSQLVGRTVKVWGETNAAQTAGWLMDVGRAEIIK